MKHRSISNSISWRIACRATGCILFALGFSFVLGGCGKKPAVSTSQTLAFGMEKDFVTLDPANLSDPITFRIVGQIYESLLALDANDSAVPAIAESWSANATGDVWTFRIRKGVFFHESPVFGAAKTRELTPQDVIYSISRSVSPGKVAGFALGGVIEGAGAYMQGKAPSVSGLRAIGDNTVEIKLTKPEPFFPYRLTSPYIAVYPKEAVDQGEDVFAKTKPVGTGPYRVTSANDAEVVLEKNARYWAGVSSDAPQSLSFRVVANEQLRQIELRNGKLDVIAATPGILPAVLEKPKPQPAGHAFLLKPDWADKVKVYANADFNSYFVAFNTEKVPLAVRRAVNLAVDRTEISDAVAYGTAIPKWGTVPDGLQGYQPPFSLPPPDPAAAAKALATSGAAGGKGSLELIVHELDSSETLGELLQARMKQVGLDVRITKLTFNEAMRRLDAGEYEAMAMKFQYVSSSPEPILEMLFASSSIPGANVWLYRSPEVDRLLASYASLATREQRNDVSCRIERQVYEDAVAVFLYQARSAFLHTPLLQRFKVNGHGIPLFYQTQLGNSH